ncbi:MAG: ABC transporter ATP-binding protein [Vallitaleaceae bacterium]|jgi:ATP-binding cassette subfamily B multidrug efflux pump|nr:ABC transporter ATP-binding protein [Vallitaleaceae bacterium]
MIVDEHDMKKGYDRQLFRRLLTYTKPYIWTIIFSVVLLVGVIGVDLIRPVIIGKAVDDVITNSEQILEVSSEDSYGAIAIATDTVDYYMVQTETVETGNIYAKMFHGDNRDMPYGLVIGISSDDVTDFDGLSYIASRSKDDGYKVIYLSENDIKKLRSSDMKRLLQLTIFYVVILVGGLLVNYFQTILLQYTGQKIVYNIRDEVFTHMQSLSIEFFGKNPVGKLVTRITNDTESLNEMYTSVIVDSVKNVLSLLGISIMMFVLDWKLTLIIFLVMPLIGMATIIFRKFSRHAYREVRTRIAGINAFLSEHISGMKLVQIFNQEENKMDDFHTANNKLKDANMLQILLYSIFRPSMYFIYIIGLAIVVGFGGNFVLKDMMTIGTLLIFLQYISNFFSPIQQLAEQFNILQSAMAAAEKIFSLLDEEAQIDEVEDGIVIEKLKGEIEFKHVWFAYNEEEWVLRDISFKVNPGETFAFVGATGAGKTSILNLISRYYDIQKGEIYIDGYNIKQLNLNSLRKHIGQMMQDVFIFTGTMKSNIRLKNEDMSDDEIVKAGKYVNADKFISKRPRKYDEKVFERGATLSTGQRQLLSFARTLAHQPNVLILDEATSNIDTETESLIQDALIKLMEGRTTLVVAHRLSTIQHANKIVVLHKGKIREMGDHQTLLTKKGLYYQLYQLQYQEVEA